MASEADEPNWLDPEEMEAWLSVASLFIRLPAALDAQLRRDSGISHFEYQVLAMLSDADGATLRLSTLAELTEGSLSRLSHVVDRLEERGWVERTQDLADRRYTTATLTHGGFGMLEQAAPGHVRIVRRLVFDSLTKGQVLDLGRSARRIVDSIEADSEATDPRQG